MPETPEDRPVSVHTQAWIAIIVEWAGVESVGGPQVDLHEVEQACELPLDRLRCRAARGQATHGKHGWTVRV